LFSYLLHSSRGTSTPAQAVFRRVVAISMAVLKRATRRFRSSMSYASLRERDIASSMLTSLLW
jgi:hypothetical protein